MERSAAGKARHSECSTPACARPSLTPYINAIPVCTNKILFKCHGKLWIRARAPCSHQVLTFAQALKLVACTSTTLGPLLHYSPRKTEKNVVICMNDDRLAWAVAGSPAGRCFEQIRQDASRTSLWLTNAQALRYYNLRMDQRLGPALCEQPGRGLWQRCRVAVACVLITPLPFLVLSWNAKKGSWFH